MGIQIKKPAQINEWESTQLEDVCDQAYRGDFTDLEWTDEEHWRVWLEVEGRIVSCLTIVEREALMGQQTLRLGGVGGVATLPAAQHRGYGSQVLQAAAIFLRDELPVDFGFLFCKPRLLPFYASLGWQEVGAPVWISQPEGSRIMTTCSMALPCRGQAWPAGELDLCGLPW